MSKGILAQPNLCSFEQVDRSRRPVQPCLKAKRKNEKILEEK
jgi:hypothetical protein